MRTIVYGNGKSRQKWNVNEKLDDVVTWGCNRIFNDVKVDNLVAVDYHVQHLIYESGYAHENKCWFGDWNILPSSAADEFVHIGKGNKVLAVRQRVSIYLPIIENNRGERQNVVVNGRYAKPNEGVYITWVDEDDMVEPIDYPREWCSGATAIHLACQQGATEIYMLGFDLNDDPKNNVYEKEQSKHTHPDSIEGFKLGWANELKTVFNEFKNVKFIWAEGEDLVRRIDVIQSHELKTVINRSMIGHDRLIFDNDNLTYDTYENIRRKICR